MTDDTQPEAMDLANVCSNLTRYSMDAHLIAAELCRQHARIAELEAELEAVGAGGVQALSAAPAGWKLVPVNPTPEMWKAAKSVPDPTPPYPPHYGLVWDAMLAASPTPPAEQQAAPKAAPGELSADSLRHQNKLLAETLGACILASGIVRKDIDGFTGPELLHFGEDLRSMLEAAPQQEAQEPVAWLNPWRADQVTTDYDAYGERGIPLYAAPQPAPAPLREREAFERDWEKRHAPVPINGRTHDDGRYGDLSIQDAWESWQARAALAAQGGKV